MASIRPAAFDAGVVQLRLLDDSAVPSTDELAGWIDRIRRLGRFSVVRSSALFPPAAERFAGIGFHAVDTLVLLRADLHDDAVVALVGARDGRSTATIRNADYEQAARVDAAAFGPRWSHDDAELREIRKATPASRVRVRATRQPGWRLERPGVPRRRRCVDAFAISGAAREHGYLQRLSVAPQAQRRGHGRALTLDALAWMQRRRLRDCLVNTSVDNDRALALYESTGYRRLPDRLAVMELALTTVASDA